MAKTLTFTFDDIDYTLEFTKRTVRQIEAEGFVADKIGEMPMTMMPMLFSGAFLSHHRHTRQDVIDKIYSALPNKEELIAALVDMYNEPIASLMDEPDEMGKVQWKKGW